ncbi:MAG: TAXI family TRAP transporter solute-binding subunit [Candidatus Adiutrix sp.]|jgi:TRAP transporter TAXI family solute receptor|nr:TAXI family TRAP transporter solute-binding subunit [Candidatus Adiutrix sp.]
MKIKSAFIPALLLALIGLAPAAAAQEFISIATGGTAGTYYPIGGAMAKAVSDAGLQATAETGNASVANINLVGAGQIAVAFAQNDTCYWAYNGQQMFEKPVKNLRVIASLYPEHVQLIVTKDSNIKAIADLKDKRVGVGAPGSGVEADVQAIFKVAGLTYDNVKADFLDFGATTNRFKDNQIDAGFVVAGYPTASIMDLANTKDVTLVSFDSGFMATLAKAHPYFVPDSIPAGTYQGMDKETLTPAVMALLVTHDQVSEEVIYKFTKALFENLETVHAAHAKAKEITLETALTGLTVPLHPGAAKYYQEKGLKLP